MHQFDKTERKSARSLSTYLLPLELERLEFVPALLAIFTRELDVAPTSENKVQVKTVGGRSGLQQLLQLLQTVDSLDGLRFPVSGVF